MPEIPARVQIMLDNCGVYVCGDSNYPMMNLVIVSNGGRLFSTTIDEPLDPTRFTPTMTMHGPYTARLPTSADQFYAGRASMLAEVVEKLKEYDAHRSAQIAAGIEICPEQPTKDVRTH